MNPLFLISSLKAIDFTDSVGSSEKSLKGLIKYVKRPENFAEREREMDMKYYSPKSKLYKDLETLANKLRSI